MNVLVVKRIVLRPNLFTNLHIKARYIQVVKTGVLLGLLVPFVEEVGPTQLSKHWMWRPWDNLINMFREYDEFDEIYSE
jgi:hypothetical protein